MKRLRWPTLARAGFAALLLPLAFKPALAQDPSAAPEPYAAHYPDYVRTSQYVPVEDGTQLVVDVYRPAPEGQPAAKKLPVLLVNFRESRPLDDRERLEMQGVLDALSHGYIVAWIEPRGSGASFGTREGFVTQQNGRDVIDVARWLKSQPYSSGKLGMFGTSNRGFIQWMALGENPAGVIDAMSPAVANPNIYYQIYPNGVSGLAGAPNVQGRGGEALSRDESAVPVDSDAAPAYPLRAAAVAEHAGNFSTGGEWLRDMARNDFNSRVNYAPGLVDSPIERFDAMRKSGTALYQMAGWFDASPTGQLVAWKALGGKILIGAWEHDLLALDEGRAIVLSERMRFFDNMLKGINNDVFEEPPIRYQTINAPEDMEWSFAADWPLPSRVRTSFFLGGGNSGTINSINDGTLRSSPDLEDAGADNYLVDLSIAAFDGMFDRLHRRWDGDMVPGVDAKGLTYTGPVLAEAIEMTGNPVAHLWVTTTATDGNFIVYLEEVLPDGTSHYVTEGTIRGAHRRLTQRAPFNTLEIPYHRSFSEDLTPIIPGEPTELVFDMHAMSYIFRHGSRIRVTVTGGELNAYSQPDAVDPQHPPTIQLLHSNEYPSRVILPLIPAGSKFFIGVDDEEIAYAAPGRVYLRQSDGWMRCLAVNPQAFRFDCESRHGPMQVTISPDAKHLSVHGENVNFEGDRQ